MGAKAAKKAGRIAAEGVILTKVEAGKATMLEVNCETDFVARDEGFLAFGNKLLDVAFEKGLNDIEALNASEIEGGVVSDVRDALVAILTGGEEELAKDVAMHVAASSPC